MRTTTETIHPSNPDLNIPAGLSPEGQAAAEAILEVLCRLDREFTGGCRAFYTPQEWAERGEDYGKDSHLIIVHDGGDLAPLLNGWGEGGRYDAQTLEEALEEVGTYSLSCTCWYTAIYAD